MPMSKKGLTKLVEECGELVQVAAKKMACMDSDEHFDKKGSLMERLEDEVADVSAALAFVIDKFGLNRERIEARCKAKIGRFRAWDAEAGTPKKK